MDLLTHTIGTVIFFNGSDSESRVTEVTGIGISERGEVGNIPGKI